MTIDATVWRARGAPLVPATGSGVLSGHTVAVKDLYAVAGFAIGAGVRSYPEHDEPEPRHAAAVTALLEAGAEITGIAQTDEFAYSISGGNGRFGMPVNPAAPDRVPGGSSSGPAVAVARGEVTVGLGTDTAGSIRVPGAYQGLWGIRTSHGRVDTRGLLPLAPSFDTVGWLTRDAQTLAAVAECLIPGTDSVPDRFVIEPYVCAVAEPGIVAAARSAGLALGAEPVDLGADLDTWYEAFRTVQAFEAWAQHGPWISAHPGALEAEVAGRFAYAATVREAAATAARSVLADAAAQIREVLARRVLVLPSTAAPPPHRAIAVADREAARAHTLRLTCLASIAGLPAVTVPVGRIGGAPAGLCLVGPRGTDRSLIRLASSSAAVLAEATQSSKEPS
ncbi:Asp-tRNA(Asn)/Glu-tRNA(Gln) amidotransferase A subunit family amidase [Nocardia transvalensis]|uniref:Asp-tRNA(Asn)/Glu-tRNA(Gln) amidotransferase A subunit family amidase n=1 Tax=Nocardia transvalensis TaxID=37333 RepID=A0A7W9PLN8_9NOCA|nr:amidase family protein [Nocardia transvalensis]MBB5918366.1 Asp-tRNA(Asn)/Glu-tRNA(Gln) amidotransferase A subunit family amidase [Nocardia transvalensis]